jgi:hypothetical protein
MAKKKKAPRKKKLSIAEIAAMHVQCLAEGKEKYKTADAALVLLRGKLQPGEMVTLPAHDWIDAALRGKRYRLRDKGDFFAVGQTARRFELKPA